MNKVILIGNIGRDLTLKQTASNTAVLNTAIATSERHKGADGEWHEQTEWHNIVVFGKSAENMARYCSKGSKVAVDGKLQTRSWEKKDGTKAYTTEVIADRVEFLTPKNADPRPQQQTTDPVVEQMQKTQTTQQPTDGDEPPPF